MKSIITLVILLVVTTDSRHESGWYSVRFQSLCEDLGREVTPERAIRHGKLSAYRIRQDTLALDTVRVSFDFISNCCEKFEGKAEIVRDTLMLSYYKINTETCRCLCDYRFIYSISDTTKTWSGVHVNALKKK